MDLSRLAQLKKKLLHDAELAPVWQFFMDHFAGRPEFIALGDRTDNEFLEVVVEQVGRKLYGKGAAVRDLLLNRIPEHQFIHGGFLLAGRIGGLFYFEQAQTGLLAVPEMPPSIRVEYARFSGRVVRAGRAVPQLSAATGNPMKDGTPMVETAPSPAKDDGPIEARVGICVVLLATFLGLCSVKASNIGQQMQIKQVDRNNNWAWYQARNIRQAVYEATADELSVPWPNEMSEGKKVREEKAEVYRRKAAGQEEKAEKQKVDAEVAQKDYEDLGAKDDQFDLCEAALAIGLALMGVTALIKRKWMFWVALVPSAFGVFMGLAGFLGWDTNSPVIKQFIAFLS